MGSLALRGAHLQTMRHLEGDDPGAHELVGILGYDLISTSSSSSSTNAAA